MVVKMFAYIYSTLKPWWKKHHLQGEDGKDEKEGDGSIKELPTGVVTTGACNIISHGKESHIVIVEGPDVAMAENSKCQCVMTENGTIVVSESTIPMEEEKTKEENSESVQTEVIQWSDLSGSGKMKRVGGLLMKPLGVLITLYFFICSLDLMGSSFILLGGRVAGGAFQSELLQNPMCGLMIGVISTAILQSSSTSTSIVVTMVAANLLDVPTAIPIIMGSNIGTSVTGIIVAVTQASEREHFRKAFAAATVHDMFNWLSVLVLLPVELATGYLDRLSKAIVDSTDLAGGTDTPNFLKAITKPFCDLFVQIDKKVLDDIASDNPEAANKSLLKYWCVTESVPIIPTTTLSPDASTIVPSTAPAMLIDGDGGEGGSFIEQIVNLMASPTEETSTPYPTMIVGVEECRYLFHGTSLSEQAVGGILLIISLTMLMTCLVMMVKLLKSLLQGSMSNVIHKTINADFPGKCSYFTGYAAMLVGVIVTVLVQSSSVVISTLTPLVGIGLVTIERVFPMMLGANIGTTSTAILAAFAATGDRIVPALQIAMVHLFFNITGILIWYPIPVMRRVPIRIAKFLGTTTSKYRWFAIMYLVCMFFLFPMSVFILSIPGWYVLASVMIPVIIIIVTVGIINVLQNRHPSCLPKKLRTWDFLPLCLRSLEPLDRQVSKLISCFRCCKCCQKNYNEEDVGSSPDNESVTTGTDPSRKQEEGLPKSLSTLSIHSLVSSNSNGTYSLPVFYQTPYQSKSSDCLIALSNIDTRL